MQSCLGESCMPRQQSPETRLSWHTKPSHFHLEYIAEGFNCLPLLYTVADTSLFDENSHQKRCLMANIGCTVTFTAISWLEWRRHEFYNRQIPQFSRNRSPRNNFRTCREQF